MRIIRIKFSNINNLKGGPWEINFDQEPIRSAGLFAITGRTGSGKSTLLDVITLALFNRIPRFSSSISTSKMEGLGSVLTRNTKEGYAEIEYEIRANRFTSKWSISRNRNGNLRDYEMFIHNELGEYLTQKKQEVPKLNEKIIGLNYQQFLKSIILAQGEFSKFIKAGKDERSKLLEQLTGTSIYRKIGIASFNKHKEVSQQLEIERAKISSAKLLSATEIEQLNQQIEYAKKEKLSLDKTIKEQSSLLKIKKDLQQQQQFLSKKEKEFQQLLAEKKTFLPQLERLSIHEKLSPAQSELTRYRDAKVNMEKTEGNLKQYQQDLKHAQEQSEKVLNRLSEITQSTVNKTNFKAIMVRFEKEINQLDNQINHLRKDGERQRNEINQFIQEHQLDFPSKIKTEEALSLIENSTKTLEKQVVNSGLNQTKINDSVELLEQNIEQLQLLDKLKTNLKQQEEKVQEQQALQQKSTVLAKEIEKSIPLISKTTALIKSWEEQKKLLVKQQEDARIIRSLEEHRLQLKDGQPCPLCGAASHPFADHMPDYVSDETENKLLAITKKMESETTLLKTYEANYVRQETELKSTQIQLDKLTTALGEQKKGNLEITKKLSGNLKGVSSELEVQDEIQKLSVQTDSLKQGISASRELKTYKALSKDFDKLKLTGQTYNALYAERQSKYKGVSISDEINPLQDSFSDSEGSIRENKKAIEIETEDLKRAQKILENNLAELQPKLKAFGLSTVEELSAQLLEEQVVQQLRNQQTKLTEQHTTLSTQINTCTKTIEQLKATDSLPEMKVEALSDQLAQQETAREELTQNVGSLKKQLELDKELREQVKTQQALISKLIREQRKWDILKRLIGDATGNTFAAHAQSLTLKNLLVLANHRLQKLSDRYLLDQPTSDGSLNVVDQYQGNAVRSISTLSGGESFMVSLALALSLSDMASQNNPLDSLFIDEGFGSLDQETLGIAIDTLERLQAESSKTVGVISHVEALKERIDVQIQLEQGPQGYSRITVQD